MSVLKVELGRIADEFVTSILAAIPNGSPRASLPSEQGRRMAGTLAPIELVDYLKFSLGTSVGEGTMDLAARLKTVFASGSEKSPASTRSAKPVVLVVEDDEALRWMLVRALEGTYNVIEAPDGRAALDLISKVRPPDAIVCDVMMPRVDGISFVRALKRIPQLMNVPVLFLTARDSTVARLEGINAGVRHYVTKPFKIADVLQKVEKMIRGPVSEVRHPAVIP